MATLYLTEAHATVRRDGETLIVQIPEDKQAGSPARKTRLPLMKVERVVVHGDVTLTGAVVRLLLERGIPVAFCSPFGRFEGSLNPPDSKNGLLRQAQHAASRDAATCMEIARSIVLGKLHNQRTLLQRTNRKRDEAAVAEAVAGIGETITWLHDHPLPEEVSAARAVLMGQEGIAAQRYFQALRHLFSDDLGFTQRVRRPPTDPINAMLSYGYALLSAAVLSALQIVGFDPYTGFLHTAVYGRPALALDLMEEFRSPIVDSVVLRVVNTNAIQKDDFETEGTGVRLTPTGRRTFLEAFERRLNDEIQHPIFNYRASYRRSLELQARILVRRLQGESPHYQPFKVR
jgi:CRISPR-associated protein Cas1